MSSNILQAIDAGVAALVDIGTKIDGLGTKLDSLQTSLDGVNTEILALSTRVAPGSGDHLAGKLDSLQTEILALSTRVAPGSGDHLAGKLDNVTTELLALSTRIAPSSGNNLAAMIDSVLREAMIGGLLPVQTPYLLEIRDALRATNTSRVPQNVTLDTTFSGVDSRKCQLSAWAVGVISHELRALQKNTAIFLSAGVQGTDLLYEALTNSIFGDASTIEPFGWETMAKAAVNLAAFVSDVVIAEADQTASEFIDDIRELIVCDIYEASDYEQALDNIYTTIDTMTTAGLQGKWMLKDAIKNSGVIDAIFGDAAQPVTQEEIARHSAWYSGDCSGCAGSGITAFDCGTTAAIVQGAGPAPAGNVPSDGTYQPAAGRLIVRFGGSYVVTITSTTGTITNIARTNCAETCYQIDGGITYPIPGGDYPVTVASATAGIQIDTSELAPDIVLSFAPSSAEPFVVCE